MTRPLRSLLPLLLLASCSQEVPDRPPRAPGSSSGSGLPGGSPSLGGGQGGEGGDGGGSPSEGALIGTVSEYASDDFLVTADVTIAGEVSGEAPTPGDPWVSAPFDGGTFTLEGVRRGTSVWLGVASDAEPGYHPTFGLEDTEQGALELALVPRQLTDDIFETLAVPQTANPSYGHLVVRTVGPSGSPAEGITVSVPGASFVTFASAGTWTEFADRTTGLGLAFVGNIPADDFPGELVPVLLGGLVDTEVEALVARDAVTILTITVQP